MILYSNKNTDSYLLAQTLYFLASKNYARQIKIDDATFYKYFKIEDINIDLQEDIIGKYL